MTLNGIINLGDAGSNYGKIYFNLNQTLTGSGVINLSGRRRITLFMRRGTMV